MNEQLPRPPSPSGFCAWCLVLRCCAMHKPGYALASGRRFCNQSIPNGLPLLDKTRYYVHGSHGSPLKTCRYHKGSLAMRISLAFILTWLSFHCAVALAADPGDVVAHWTFNEGKGKTARDISGNGNHGRIRGAKYIRHTESVSLRLSRSSQCHPLM